MDSKTWQRQASLMVLVDCNEKHIFMDLRSEVGLELAQKVEIRCSEFSSLRVGMLMLLVGHLDAGGQSLGHLVDVDVVMGWVIWIIVELGHLDEAGGRSLDAGDG